MEGGGVKQTRDEMEREAVAPVVLAAALSEVATATDGAVRPVAVRHEVVVPPSGRWTLDSPVEDVLMEDCGGLDGMRVHDFLLEHFGEAFGSPSVSMCLFIDDPTLFVTDESVLVKVTNSSPYVEFVRKYELHKAMREAVRRLHTKWIFTLRRWAGAAAANEVEDIDASLKVKLNAALFIARRNERPVGISIAPTAEKIDTVYDSVFYASWSYVVMGKEYGEGTLGMGVLDATSGEQPRLWSEVQADVPYDPEEP
ncbi:unnamed protein product [Trypanosoma congolense IL3000]|uniref:WGS project CAEQ00000000 data, annotated contig 406 n=1 Tax=Trypanosoma congolense (strain IL3000) TaxID=1068625 RepID=F9WFN2_TRYCI|nr:unnamed protein product [Trypanosoma congolense IL3000]